MPNIYKRRRMKRAFRDEGTTAVKLLGGLGFLLLVCGGSAFGSAAQTGDGSNTTQLPFTTRAGLLPPMPEPALKSEELDLLSAKIATATQPRRSSSVTLEGASLAPVPEPSTVLFGSALLVACGASLRAVRRKS